MPTAKKPDPRDQGVDLETYSDRLDAQVGESLMLAENVVELHAVKARIAVLSARRDAIYSEVKVQYARGGRGNRNWWLHETEVPSSVKRTVPSDACKKADKGLWERSRVLRPWVSVKQAAGYAPLPIGPALRLPAVPSGYASITEVIDAYKSPVFEEIAALKAREDELKLALRVIDAQIGHDGTERRFTDGWAVMTARRQFDADQLKRIDAVAYTRLAQDVVTPPTTRIVLMDRASALDKGYLEIGGIEYAD